MEGQARMPTPTWLGERLGLVRIPGAIIPGEGLEDGHASVPPAPPTNVKTSPQLP